MKDKVRAGRGRKRGHSTFSSDGDLGERLDSKSMNRRWTQMNAGRKGASTYDLDDNSTTTVYDANDLNQYEDTTKPAETFGYDEDGNLETDGTYDYTWNAENRLISVAPASSPASGDKKLEFAYDYMGRRVRKYANAGMNGNNE